MKIRPENFRLVRDLNPAWSFWTQSLNPKFSIFETKFSRPKCHICLSPRLQAVIWSRCKKSCFRWNDHWQWEILVPMKSKPSLFHLSFCRNCLLSSIRASSWCRVTWKVWFRMLGHLKVQMHYGNEAIFFFFFFFSLSKLNGCLISNTALLYLSIFVLLYRKILGGSDFIWGAWLFQSCRRSSEGNLSGNDIPSVTGTLRLRKTLSNLLSRDAINK